MKDTDKRQVGLSRRGFLGGLAGTASLPLAAAAVDQVPPATMVGTDRSVTGDIEGLEALDSNEADVLEAVCARLIPADENGPGAREARVAHYIDRALAGPLRPLRETYALGLAALDRYAQSSEGARFADLPSTRQDAILGDLEKNAISGITPDSRHFFDLVREHTLQGMFSDPYWGGNHKFVGWDLLGYPGLRMPVTAEDQRFEKPTALRASAYDGGMFARGR